MNSKLSIKKLFNLSLRVFALGSKFLLALYIGKYLPTELMGEYGLVNSILTIGVILIGFDLYIPISRSILSEENNIRQRKKLQLQLDFYLIVYSVLFLSAFIVLLLGIDISWIVIGLLLLITTHQNSELFRLLIVFKKPIIANWVFLIANGMWVYPLIFNWYLNQISSDPLVEILIYWIIATCISNGFALFSMRSYLKGYSPWQIFRLSRYKRDFIVGIKYLQVSLLYKSNQFVDRFIILYFLDNYFLGIYTFFMQIANTINTLIFSAIISFIYPFLIENATKRKKSSYFRTKKKMIYEILGFSSIILVILIVTIDEFLLIIDKKEFSDNQSIMWIILISNIALNLSLIFNYSLVGFELDKQNIKSSIYSFLITVIFGFLLTFHWGLIGMCIAKLAGTTFLLASKYIFVTKYERTLIWNSDIK